MKTRTSAACRRIRHLLTTIIALILSGNAHPALGQPAGVPGMNPVIWADVPDASVIRVGDVYYMTSTTMHLSPGVPALLHRRRWALVKLLDQISRRPVTIDWAGLVQMQTICLRNGINRVGVPDLIIAQHSIQNEYRLFACDRHFMLMAEFLPLALY